MAAADFDIDIDELKALGETLGAMPQQVHQSFGRALSRTAGTLRRMSLPGLRSELELRTMAHIRKRLKTMKFKRKGKKQEVVLWYGLNDLHVSAFKGRPTQNSAGATFKGHQYDGAFVAKNRKGKNTIFKRKGKHANPLSEQAVPVKEQMEYFLEDNVFNEAEEIFFKHFQADLWARVLHGAGWNER